MKKEIKIVVLVVSAFSLYILLFFAFNKNNVKESNEVITFKDSLVYYLNEYAEYESSIKVIDHYVYMHTEVYNTDEVDMCGRIKDSQLYVGSYVELSIEEYEKLTIKQAEELGVKPVYKQEHELSLERWLLYMDSKPVVYDTVNNCFTTTYYYYPTK